MVLHMTSTSTKFVGLASGTLNLRLRPHVPLVSLSLPGRAHGLAAEVGLGVGGWGNGTGDRAVRGPVANQPGTQGRGPDGPVRAPEDSAPHLPEPHLGSKGITIPRVPNTALRGGPRHGYFLPPPCASFLSAAGQVHGLLASTSRGVRGLPGDSDSSCFSCFLSKRQIMLPAFLSPLRMLSGLIEWGRVSSYFLRERH